MKPSHFCILVVTAVILSGCASSGQRAPVIDRSGSHDKRAATTMETREMIAREKDWRPETYIVQKGDTLYSIAFNYGFDYHELAELNGIRDPAMIQVGQKIRLFPASTTTAISPAALVETRPIEAPPKEQPRLAKYPYSETAVAEIEKVQEQKQPEVVAVAKPEPKPELKPEPKPAAKPEGEAESSADEALEWSLPTQGKVISGFSESANRKGIDITGKLGQPVTASAPGKVVYSGSGLRGYGKLVIIKHNKTYLSAYAHNDQILVKEGQTVTRGQKIAEMGNTDADRVKLHFEVRRFGKPVDPAKFLSFDKS